MLAPSGSAPPAVAIRDVTLHYFTPDRETLALSSVSLEVEATHIPSEVQVSIEGLTGGTSITAGEITLPSGSKLLSDPDLTVIANTGDDLEIYGAHVSPDPDLVTFWLADAIDERGWGLAGDTFAATFRPENEPSAPG